MGEKAPGHVIDGVSQLSKTKTEIAINQRFAVSETCGGPLNEIWNGPPREITPRVFALTENRRGGHGHGCWLETEMISPERYEE